MIDKCPVCKRGKLIEWKAGVYCSRRYAKKNPCSFDAPLCDSPEQWNSYVEMCVRSRMKGNNPR